MEKKKLEAFLQEYAGILREDVNILNDFPLSFRTEMPAGCAVVTTRDGRDICGISVKGGGQCSSMPVSSVDLTYARLIVDLLNRWAELQSAKSDE